MPKVYRDNTGLYLFYCPGCDCDHGVWVDFPNPTTGGRWTFNGNVEWPTFNPSLLISWNLEKDYKRICHSVIKDGVIEYLNDCTHALAGKRVEMEEIESD